MKTVIYISQVGKESHRQALKTHVSSDHLGRSLRAVRDTILRDVRRKMLGKTRKVKFLKVTIEEVK